MAENNSQVIKVMQIDKPSDDLRLLPFLIAGLFCFAIALFLGTGSWYLLHLYRQNVQIIAEDNSPKPANPEVNQIAVENQPNPLSESVSSPNPTITPEQPATQTEPPSDEIVFPENVVPVAGNEVVIGGSDTKKPLERLFVKDFSIGETEVTNSQYARFIEETNYPAPIGWNKSKFPAGTENFPVTNVSWKDAEQFCAWMSKKVGSKVRLPSEAEWELAAKGQNNYKYPWGNEWQKGAAITKETGGKITAVKSFNTNRSPFGAYDMVGNVWEWTQDKVEKSEETSNELANKALKSGQTLRIVKGGSATATRDQLSTKFRGEIPEQSKVKIVGFRYVIESK